MLNQAKSNLAHLNNVKFLEPVGTENIALSDHKTVDIITAIQSHHYLSESKRKKATENCFALLDKAGLYIIFENIYPNSEVGKEIGLKRWAAYQLSQGKDQHAIAAHIGRFNTAFFPITLEAHLALLKACGFKVADIFWLS